jgi:transcriptional antiterminator Rof (Rho-off)
VADKYIPIACQLYDKLEELAVKKVKTKITYLDYY